MGFIGRSHLLEGSSLNFYLAFSGLDLLEVYARPLWSIEMETVSYQKSEYSSFAVQHLEKSYLCHCPLASLLHESSLPLYLSRVDLTS